MDLSFTRVNAVKTTEMFRKREFSNSSNRQPVSHPNTPTSIRNNRNPTKSATNSSENLFFQPFRQHLTPRNTNKQTTPLQHRKPQTSNSDISIFMDNIDKFNFLESTRLSDYMFDSNSKSSKTDINRGNTQPSSSTDK